MSSISFDPPKSYNNLEELIDEREFHLGEIWTIRDSLISIPDADRIENRKKYYSRSVVIVDNNNQNSNKLSPVISVAPLSSRTDCLRELDIPLFRERDQMKEDSILRLSLVQPVLKRDLHKCVGEISKEAKDEIIEVMLQKIGVTLEEL